MRAHFSTFRASGAMCSRCSCAQLSQLRSPSTRCVLTEKQCAGAYHAHISTASALALRERFHPDDERLACAFASCYNRMCTASDARLTCLHAWRIGGARAAHAHSHGCWRSSRCSCCCPHDMQDRSLELVLPGNDLIVTIDMSTVLHTCCRR